MEGAGLTVELPDAAPVAGAGLTLELPGATFVTGAGTTLALPGGTLVAGAERATMRGRMGTPRPARELCETPAAAPVAAATAMSSTARDESVSVSGAGPAVVADKVSGTFEGVVMMRAERLRGQIHTRWLACKP